MRKELLAVVCAGVLASGCTTVYQMTMEKVFGIEKRQFLKSSVESVSKDQKKAQAEFKDAMTRLKELYAFSGGNLEGMYNKLKSAYEDSKNQALVVSNRINAMDDIANSMFGEWEREIAQFTNQTFAANSRQQFTETRARYAKLLEAVRKSESAMDPVLRQLNDHVLYLKHNLNSMAIGSLKTEAASIQSQIDSVIQSMNASISEAERFIKELNKG